MPTLGSIATESTQPVGMAFGCDLLGGDSQTKRMSEVNHCFSDLFIDAPVTEAIVEILDKLSSPAGTSVSSDGKSTGLQTAAMRLNSLGQAAGVQRDCFRQEFSVARPAYSLYAGTMATAHHGQPGTQIGPRQDPFPPGAPPTPPVAPPGGNRPYAPLPPRRSTSKASAIATGVAIVIATAALVVGTIGLVRPSTSAAPVAGTTLPPSPHTAADSTAANRSLCTAIAPLMSESNRTAQVYSNLGPANSSDWNAGIPKFLSDTKDWVGRIQPVIDGHPDADPYLRRSIQRFVDDRRYLVADLEAGPWQPYDQTIWNDSLSALGGPLSICWDLGVKW